MDAISTKPIEYNTLIGRKIVKLSASNIECTPGNKKRVSGTGEGEIITSIMFFDKQEDRFFRIWTLSGACYKVPQGAGIETKKVNHSKPRRWNADDTFPGAVVLVHKSSKDGDKKPGDTTTTGRRIYVRDLGDGVVIGVVTDLKRSQSNHGGYSTNKVTYTLFSNVHWSERPVTVCVDDDYFGQGMRVDYNYGSGGCEPMATNTQIARANAGMHALAAEILALYPEGDAR